MILNNVYLKLKIIATKYQKLKSNICIHQLLHSLKITAYFNYFHIVWTKLQLLVYVSISSWKMKSSMVECYNPEIKSSTLPRASSTLHGAQEPFPSRNCKCLCGQARSSAWSLGDWFHAVLCYLFKYILSFQTESVILVSWDKHPTKLGCSPHIPTPCTVFVD